MSTPTPSTLLRAKTVVIVLLVCGVCIALAHALDPWACRASARFVGSLSKPVAMFDWYQQLRQLGSVVPWLILALVWWLAGVGARARHELPRPERIPTALALAVVIAGVAAELFKPLIGRMRPEDTGGVYLFMPLGERAGRWSDLGIPSSHAAVAFAAALVLTRWRPLAGVVLIPLALGTSLTRVLNANHFFSDTATGAAIGLLSAWASWSMCKGGRAE
jgi:membrane-associated phospholipid phosphatase